MAYPATVDGQLVAGRDYYRPWNRRLLVRWLKEHYLRDLGRASIHDRHPVAPEQAQNFCNTHSLDYRPGETYTPARLARMLGRKMGPRSDASLYAEQRRIWEEGWLKRYGSDPRPSERLVLSDAGPVRNGGQGQLALFQ